jgi:opacity protein-like surface antigen
MISLRSWFVSLAVLVALLASAPVQAQGTAQTQSTGGSSWINGRISLHVNFGAQVGSGDLTQRFTPIIYDETATIDIAQTYESGPLFDIGGSYTVYGDFGVGVSYSHTSGDGNATIAAEIPDPLVFDRPRAASATASSLGHSENQVHISMLYRFAAMPKLDVTVGIGPTFFSVKQDLVPTVEVTEASPSPVITPHVVEGSDSAVGVHVSADATYMVTDNIGAGVLLRFARSTAEVSAESSQSIDVKAGGFQIAAGVRVRF